MDDIQFETLYDPYKETNQMRLESQKRRNRYFVIICILEVLSYFFLIRPEKAMSLFQSIIKERFGIETIIGNNLIQSMLWILIAYYITRYIQETLYVERQYKYQDYLEKKLNDLKECDLFGREGEWYHSEYPNSLSLIDIFYKMICPIIIFAINIYKIVIECKAFSGSTIIDLIACIVIEIILWAYFFDLHPGISEWCRKHIPGLK